MCTVFQSILVNLHDPERSHTYTHFRCTCALLTNIHMQISCAIGVPNYQVSNGCTTQCILVHCIAEIYAEQLWCWSTQAFPFGSADCSSHVEHNWFGESRGKGWSLIREGGDQRDIDQGVIREGVKKLQNKSTGRVRSHRAPLIIVCLYYIVQIIFFYIIQMCSQISFVCIILYNSNVYSVAEIAWSHPDGEVRPNVNYLRNLQHKTRSSFSILENHQ